MFFCVHEQKFSFFRVSVMNGPTPVHGGLPPSRVLRQRMVPTSPLNTVSRPGISSASQVPQISQAAPKFLDLQRLSTTPVVTQPLRTHPASISRTSSHVSPQVGPTIRVQPTPMSSRASPSPVYASPQMVSPIQVVNPSPRENPGVTTPISKIPIKKPWKNGCC